MSDKKYIELSKVIDVIMSIPVPADSYFAIITDAGKELCVSVVQNVQSADVAPVVHGYWEDGDADTISCICSVCKHKYHLYEDDINGYEFCANCGAKMDESEE